MQILRSWLMMQTKPTTIFKDHYRTWFCYSFDWRWLVPNQYRQSINEETSLHLNLTVNVMFQLFCKNHYIKNMQQEDFNGKNSTKNTSRFFFYDTIIISHHKSSDNILMLWSQGLNTLLLLPLCGIHTKLICIWLSISHIIVFMLKQLNNTKRAEPHRM